MKDEPDGLNEMDWWSRARLHDPHDLTTCRCVALIPWRKLWWSTEDADSWKQSEYQTFWDTDWPRSFFAARLWLGPWAVVLGIIPLKTRLFDFLSHHPSFAKSFSHAGFAADFKLAPAIWAEISRTMACGATHRKQRISVLQMSQRKWCRRRRTDQSPYRFWILMKLPNLPRPRRGEFRPALDIPEVLSDSLCPSWREAIATRCGPQMDLNLSKKDWWRFPKSWGYPQICLKIKSSKIPI